jgi:hypothetical protein
LLNYFVDSEKHSQSARYCELEGLKEVSNLKAGMDFRHPQYRREVFLRFYEFHLKYKSHPGCVYYLMPSVAAAFSMSVEEKLWFAFLNGNTQHPATSLLIYKAFPSYARLSEYKLETWFNKNYSQLGWDTDRRYHKKDFLKAVASYKALCGRSQEEFFKSHYGVDEEDTFRNLWKTVRKSFYTFGRLSTFSYLEYLRIMNVPVDCDNLFLEDMSGSKSHRNGLSKVLGRDDLDWSRFTPFEGRYAPGQVAWLADEGTQLRADARKRFKGAPYARDVSYFTMESAFCTYKSWHRPNRRYPNVYNDMLYRRLKDTEQAHPTADLSVLWAAREAALPPRLRLEASPADPGLTPAKQNWYRETGQVIMLDGDWPCFKNDFAASLTPKKEKR